MDNAQYTIRVHPAAEGGFWAEVPALPGCFSQGESLEEVTAGVREAIECYLTSLALDGKPFPVEKRVRQAFRYPVIVRAPRSA